MMSDHDALKGDHDALTKNHNSMMSDHNAHELLIMALSSFVKASCSFFKS
jgi:hypothetical protein